MARRVNTVILTFASLLSAGLPPTKLGLFRLSNLFFLVFHFVVFNTVRHIKLALSSAFGRT